MTRGAIVYDIVMAWRHDRADAKDARSLLSRLASNFRDDDLRERDGRKSWEPIEQARQRNARHLGKRGRL